MKNNFWAVLVVVCSSQLLTAPLWADDSTCESAVDMADSLDFSKLHVDCAEDPDVVYDPNQRGGLFGLNKKAVNTYATTNNSQSAKVDQQVSRLQSSTTAVKQEDLGLATSKTVSGYPTASRQASASLSSAEKRLETDRSIEGNAGVVFNIREPFTLTGGPQSALHGLFVQMAQYCPQGWEKLREWSVPQQADYFLHYQFQCAE